MAATGKYCELFSNGTTNDAVQLLPYVHLPPSPSYPPPRQCAPSQVFHRLCVFGRGPGHRSGVIMVIRSSMVAVGRKPIVVFGLWSHILRFGSWPSSSPWRTGEVQYTLVRHPLPFFNLPRYVCLLGLVTIALFCETSYWELAVAAYE